MGNKSNLPGWCDNDAIRALMPSMIPESYRKLVVLIGVPAFLEICGAWGGRQHYFPTMEHVSRHGIISPASLSPADREVVARIGIQPFMDLVEANGGRFVYLPKPTAIMRPVRDMKIREDYRHGQLKVSEIAEKYGLTCTTVNAICKGLQDERKTAIKRFA